MNVRQIMNFINQMEEKYPVDRWVIDGIDIWPIIRFQIYFILYEKHTFEQKILEKKSSKKVSKKIKIFVLLILSYFKSLVYPLFKPKDFLIFPVKSEAVVFDDASYIMFEGKYYNRFVDPIVEDLHKRNKIVFSISLHENYNTPRYSPVKCIKPYLRIKILMCSFKKSKLKNISLNEYEHFYSYISSLDDSLKILSEKKIINYAFSIKIIKNYVIKILKKIKPKAVFQVSYYSVYGMAISFAANYLNIPCVEIQHGTQNDFHVGYGLWKRVPQDGFNSLPNIFACWDKEACETILRWTDNKSLHKPFLFGNRFLEKFKAPSAIEKSAFASVFRKIDDGRKPRKHVLLTLQFMFGFPDIFASMLKMSPSDYFWWIRFHPMMAGEESAILGKLRTLGVQNIETEQATQNALYAILPFMDVHVTLNSSVVHEAKQFGVSSVVCDGTAQEYYADDINGKDLILALTPEDIIAALERAPARQQIHEGVSADQLYDYLGL